MTTNDRPGLQVVERPVGAATVVRLDGELDSHTAPQAQVELDRVLDRAPAVALDLGGTTYLSSAGLRVLLLAHRRAVAGGVRLTLTGLLPDIRDLMAATGFLEFFEVSATVDEAVAALSAQPDQDGSDRRVAS